MKRFPVLVSLLVAIAVAALCVGSAVGSTSTSVKFKASYKGTVAESVNGTDVSATPTGSGTASVIGKGSLTGSVAANTSNPPCTPLSGPGTLKGSKGTLKLTLVAKSSRACAAGQDDQNNISFSGKATVTSGTKSAKKLKGSLIFHGHYDRGTGAFNVTLTGTLKH